MTMTQRGRESTRMVRQKMGATMKMKRGRCRRRKTKSCWSIEEQRLGECCLPTRF